jgi:DNA (cytosine-5)-methyltransferase 1
MSIPHEPNSNKLRFIDLFCGIGGFHQALKPWNTECVFACDIDADCRQVYYRNYGLEPAGDITKIKVEQIPPFDVLCAGYPCVAFSKAGAQMGFDDPAGRGQLFFDIIRIAAHHRPAYMLLENVRNLVSHDDGRTWRIMHHHIVHGLGYQTYETPIILNTLHFGVPQNRERVIIMCKRRDLGVLPPQPVISKNPKLGLPVDALLQLLEPAAAAASVATTISLKLEAASAIWDDFLVLVRAHVAAGEVPKFPLWTDWWDSLPGSTETEKKYETWIQKNRTFYQTNRVILEPWLQKARRHDLWTGAMRKLEWQAGDLLPTDGMNTLLWTTRSSGIRVKRPDYVPTLVAMTSMVPVIGGRHLSPREMLRLQSFPEDFIPYEAAYASGVAIPPTRKQLTTITKQTGNAVNVNMIEACFRFLILGDVTALNV